MQRQEPSYMQQVMVAFRPEGSCRCPSFGIKGMKSALKGEDILLHGVFRACPSHA